MKKFISILLFVASLWALPASAAIALYGSVQTAWDTGAGTSTVTLPGSGVLAANTIFFLQTVIMNSGSPGTTTPATWNTFTNSSQNCGVGGMALFYKIYNAGQTPPSTVVVSFADSGNTHQGVIATAYTGVNTSTPIDVTGTPTCSSVSAATITAPSVTTTVNGDQILYFYQIGCGCDVGASASFSVGTGTIQGQLTRSITGAEGYAAYADHNQASSGATGTNALTWSSGNNEQPLTGMTVAIEPALALNGSQFSQPAVIRNENEELVLLK